jgi:hypothetical protein
MRQQAVWPGMRADFAVQRVRRLDDDHAAVRYVITVQTITLRMPVDGVAVRVDGAWKVSRATTIEMLLRAGAEPPF